MHTKTKKRDKEKENNYILRDSLHFPIPYKKQQVQLYIHITWTEGEGNQEFGSDEERCM